MADPAFASSFGHLPRFIRVLYGINRIYVRSWHHVRVLNPCPAPAHGGGIVVSNHSAGIDPFVVQATCSRFITWMMAKEYYDLPVAGAICAKLGYIPVTRSGRDTPSLKAALRVLAKDQMLGVFPEGRIAPTKDLLPFQPGVVMMAHRAGVPIYPAFVRGMRRNMSIVEAFLDPQDLTICYGDPIIVGKDLEAGNAKVLEAIDLLRKQSLA